MAAFDPADHRADDVRDQVDQILRDIPPPPPESADHDTAVADTDTSWIYIEGYRVQLSLHATREQAEAAAAIARQRFPQDSVYVVFETPWHKVRVGDFRTRDEAVAMMNEAKARGYRDPFWLPSRVRVIRRPGDHPLNEQ